MLHKKSNIHNRQRDHREAARRDGEGGEDVVRPEVVLSERSDLCAKSSDDDAAEDGKACGP